MTTQHGRAGARRARRPRPHGLDRAGRDLTGNPDVVGPRRGAARRRLARPAPHHLRLPARDGRWTTEQRETYDRGNGATILLYDPERRTVLLTRQFRFPAYVNGHPDGMLVETAAGLLDDDDPATAIRRETAEELGVDGRRARARLRRLDEPRLGHRAAALLRRALHAGRPHRRRRRRRRGRRGHRGRRTDFDEALRADRDGRIADAKTIMLLQWAALDGPFSRDR